MLGFGKRLARRQRAGLDRPVGARSVLENGLVIHVAHHHEGGVVGHIPALVPVAGVLGGHVVQIAHPADNRPAVGVGLEGGGHQLLHHQRTGLVVGAQAALFLDHLDLLLEGIVGHLQVGHAVGLERHHLAERLLGHLLEVGGVVVAGEGVVAATHGGHTLVELAGPHLAGALEHHVLEQVGHTGGAIHLVHRPHLVPDHMHHRRSPAVFLDDQLHPVGKRALEGVGPGRSGEGRGQGAHHGADAQTAIHHRLLKHLVKFKG